MIVNQILQKILIGPYPNSTWSKIILNNPHLRY